MQQVVNHLESINIVYQSTSANFSINLNLPNSHGGEQASFPDICLW